MLPHCGQAQTVQGIVRDRESRLPVSGADVYLLDTADTIVSVTSTAEDGRFSLSISSPGTYRLSFSRLGYGTTLTAPFVLGPEEDRDLEVSLPGDPIPMESLGVVGTSRSTKLARTGFYERMGKGFGYFIQREEIDRRHASEVTDLLYGLPNVRIVRGTVNMRACPRSPTIVLDGMAVGGKINELLSPASIEAIEVYLGPGGVPPQYGGLRNPCGAILIWTRW
jgi:hypothetical protein